MSTRGRGMACTAPTRSPPAAVRAPAGSSTTISTTNESAIARVTVQLRSQSHGGVLWPARTTASDRRQPTQKNRRKGVLRELRRTRLLNDERRGPCGRIDQIGDVEREARFIRAVPQRGRFVE